MKKIIARPLVLAAVAAIVLSFSACPTPTNSDPRPPAAEVRTAYDKCDADVGAARNTKGTFFFTSPTLTCTATGPSSCVYDFKNFVSGAYTIKGQTNATTTATGSTSKGSYTLIGGDITTLTTDINYDNTGTAISGTMVVNGYPYDYATASYK